MLLSVFLLSLVPMVVSALDLPTLAPIVTIAPVKLPTTTTSSILTTLNLVVLNHDVTSIPLGLALPMNGEGETISGVDYSVQNNQIATVNVPLNLSVPKNVYIPNVNYTINVPIDLAIPAVNITVPAYNVTVDVPAQIVNSSIPVNLANLHDLQSAGASAGQFNVAIPVIVDIPDANASSPLSGPSQQPANFSIPVNFTDPSSTVNVSLPDNSTIPETATPAMTDAVTLPPELPTSAAVVTTTTSPSRNGTAADANEQVPNDMAPATKAVAATVAIVALAGAVYVYSRFKNMKSSGTAGAATASPIVVDVAASIRDSNYRTLMSQTAVPVQVERQSDVEAATMSSVKKRGNKKNGYGMLDDEEE
eukprot:TRINITY_DN22346_c0_g1_i1.p1 TRINITY_DN22346_c0_g1~~TRINITY_DN22346_c0_g1_i1.p1  ORF type:complete len:364 (-),score=102.86 TRINITY_DN22346_c0_g1_i1:27-1118(-)